MRTKNLFLLLGTCLGLLAANPSSAWASGYTLYYDVSVVSTSGLDVAARNKLRFASLNYAFTSSGLAKAGREVLGAESMYSPQLRVALFGISPRQFAESRPLSQSIQTAAGPIPVGTIDVIVTEVAGSLSVNVGLLINSPQTDDYPSITHAEVLSLPSDGGRGISMLAVPGRTDVVYLVRLAVTPTD